MLTADEAMMLSRMMAEPALAGERPYIRRALFDYYKALLAGRAPSSIPTPRRVRK